MTEAEKLVACLREIGFDAQIRDVDYSEGFRGLSDAKTVRKRVDIGCHFLFDGDGKLVGMQSEFDGWVTSATSDPIAIIGYSTEEIEGLGHRVVAVDLLFRDATHARKVLFFTEYDDGLGGQKVYVLPAKPEIRSEGVVHRLRFRFASR